MESFDKELKDLSDQRVEHSLSLRKQKINKHILQRRLGLNNKKYSIKKEEIIIKEQFKNKQFQNIIDLLNFTSNILENEQSDINDIKFAIFLLKSAEIKKDNGEVNNTNIIKAISKPFSKYIDNTIIVDEIITILINFSYYLKIETNLNLLNSNYLNIYAQVSKQYFEDDTIFHDLITLLGNLANENTVAQKIFYQTKLFEEIFSLVQNPKSPKPKKDICLWFLAIFTKGIQNNNYFIKNIDLFKKLIDIMLSNFKNEEHIIYCLDSLGNLSDIESMAEYIISKKELFDFIFENRKPDYYILTHKIIANITSFNENINLYLLQNYKAIPYFLELLESFSSIIKGQILFIIGNILENKPSKINEILDKVGIIEKVFGFLDSSLVEVLDKALFILNVLMASLNNEGIFRLFQKNIHLKLINILKNDYKREIIDKTTDAIIEFLAKDSQDGIIRQSFIDNGLKEVFSTMILDRNDADIYMKTEEILKNYF